MPESEFERMLREEDETDPQHAEHAQRDAIHAAADRGVDALRRVIQVDDSGPSIGEPDPKPEPEPDPRVIEQAMEKMQIPVEKRGPCVKPNIVRHSPLHAPVLPQIDMSIGAPPPRTADPRPDLPKDPDQRLAARQRERDRDIARQHRHRFKRYRG